MSKPELLPFEVVGPLNIICAKTGNSVPTGGVVYLDPDKTVIPWLVDGGHVKPMPAKTAQAGQSEG